MTDPLAELEQHLASDESDEALANGLVIVAMVAGNDIEISDAELNGASRRALLMLAAGGDPGRGLDLHGRSVESMASDLDAGGRREALVSELGLLARSDHPHVARAAQALVDDPDIAWRAFAAARLAEVLAEDDA